MLGPALVWLWQDSWEQPSLPSSQAGTRMHCTSASQMATFLLPLKIFVRTLASHRPEAHVSL